MFVTKLSIDKWKRRTNARLNLQTLLSSNFSHTKSCLRTLILATRSTAIRIHCENRSSAQLFVLHGRVGMKIFSLEDVSVYNLSHNFPCLCSTEMFPRTVSTTRRVHVRVRALKGLMSAHFSN